MSPAFAPARAARYVIAGARVPRSLLAKPVGEPGPENLARLDLLVDDGRIKALASAGALEAGDAPRLEIGGGLVLPLFVDAHTHLDKGHIWRRAPNPTGAFVDALASTTADREANWSAEDVERRMEFALRAAYAHGTRAIRTHIDSLGPQIEVSWPVFAAVRERWRGRIELQGSPLFGLERVFDAAHMASLEATVGRCGSNVLGAVSYAMPKAREALSILFGLAERKGWDIDLHVDENADPQGATLATIAEVALERQFAGKILVGHCCSLSLQSEAERARTVELCARARLAVVSLPLCNLFLQDRTAGRTPRWRGVTALQELKAGGVPALIASDNTRDPFYAYGDLDMLEVWREGVRVAHLDYPFDDWAPAVFSTPAAAMRIGAGRIEAGAPADLILTRARSFTELFSRPQRDRTVLRAGVADNAAPPDYAELDALEGLQP